MKQIYPASITGKGFAAGGSVLDHKFGQGDPYTLGVEEEYMLDGDTLDLVQHIDTVLADMSGHELEQRINPELMQSVLEIATPVPGRSRGRVATLNAEGLRRLDRVPARYEGRLRRDASVLCCSSVNGSPRATATEISSTRCSTSHGASSSSGCTSTSPSTTPRRRSRW